MSEFTSYLSNDDKIKISNVNTQYLTGDEWIACITSHSNNVICVINEQNANVIVDSRVFKLDVKN